MSEQKFDADAQENELIDEIASLLPANSELRLNFKSDDDMDKKFIATWSFAGKEQLHVRVKDHELEKITYCDDKHDSVRRIDEFEDGMYAKTKYRFDGQRVEHQVRVKNDVTEFRSYDKQLAKELRDWQSETKFDPVFGPRYGQVSAFASQLFLVVEKMEHLAVRKVRVSIDTDNNLRFKSNDEEFSVKLLPAASN